MEAIKEKAPITSKLKKDANNQDGKIGGMKLRFTQDSTQDTSSKISISAKHVSHNCAICRTEYLLLDFKSSRICDECVQYIKDNC